MTSTSANTSFFMNAQAAGFGTAAPSDERMHHAVAATISDPALVETQFFSFSVPDSLLMAFCYQWAHPNLGIFGGGPIAFTGTKTRQLSAELIHLRDLMPDDAIRADGDLDRYVMPHSGYTVEILDPLAKARLTYEDPARGNRIDVTFEAIMPPAMLSSGKHFDQVMRTSGHIALRGREFVVDGYGARDRSWGEIRPEDPLPVPPVHYLVPIFGDDLALNIVGVENPGENPIWRDIYPMDAAGARRFNRGWVWDAGELTPLSTVDIRTEWDRATGMPKQHVVKCVDANGRAYDLTAEVICGCPWNTWSNAQMNLCLARWHYNGRVGYGDSQHALWTDFAQLLT